MDETVSDQDDNHRSFLLLKALTSNIIWVTAAQHAGVRAVKIPLDFHTDDAYAHSPITVNENFRYFLREYLLADCFRF